MKKWKQRWSEMLSYEKGFEVAYWRKERHLAHFCILLAILYGFGAIRDIVGLFI